MSKGYDVGGKGSDWCLFLQECYHAVKNNLGGPPHLFCWVQGPRVLFVGVECQLAMVWAEDERELTERSTRLPVKVVWQP